jgi:hypothetical protein
VTWRRLIVVLAAVIAVTMIGSYAYWRDEGSAGTPAQFRERVAEAGLVVDWENNGPRGGDGSVSTDCGPVDITISDLDGELWLIAPIGNERLAADSFRALIACEWPED